MERATHNCPPNPSCPVSEGEKDSGFSDGSLECLSTIEQMNTEDPASAPLPPRPVKSQKAKEGLLGGTFPVGLTPLYLIKNMILEQVACVAGHLGQALPHSPSPRSGCPSLATPSTCLPTGVYGTQHPRIGCHWVAQGSLPSEPLPLSHSPMTHFLAWSNQHLLESPHSSAAHPLLLLEPTVSLKPMLPSQKPSAKEIPTLSACPRIATHLGWQAEEAPSPVAEPSRHKQFYVDEAWASPEAPTAKDSCEKLPEESPASSQTSALVCPEAPTWPTLSCTGLSPDGDRMAVKGARRLGGHSLVRQHRLHSTVEILRRSGLLGITLRTKELLRQNSRTQRELAQLQEEAQLLCKAIRSSDSRVWAHLQDAICCSAAPCPSSKGAGARTHMEQQPNLATQPMDPLLSSSGLALGPDTTLPVALP